MLCFCRQLGNYVCSLPDPTPFSSLDFFHLGCLLCLLCALSPSCDKLFLSLFLFLSMCILRNRKLRLGCFGEVWLRTGYSRVCYLKILLVLFRKSCSLLMYTTQEHLFGRMLAQHTQGTGQNTSTTQAGLPTMQCCTPVVSALRRQRKKEQKFKVIIA